jgi:hypothetical protein
MESMVEIVVMSAVSNSYAKANLLIDCYNWLSCNWKKYILYIIQWRVRDHWNDLLPNDEKYGFILDEDGSL